MCGKLHVLAPYITMEVYINQFLQKYAIKTIFSRVFHLVMDKYPIQLLFLNKAQNSFHHTVKLHKNYKSIVLSAGINYCAN